MTSNSTPTASEVAEARAEWSRAEIRANATEETLREQRRVARGKRKHYEDLLLRQQGQGVLFE